MQDVVVYGLGELGRLIAGGAARAGFRVTPIVRGVEPARVLADVAKGAPVFVCVGETALVDAVAAVPASARASLVLLQNDLFPDAWRALGLDAPTVMVPWILKKKDLPTRIIQATPVHGRHAAVVAAVHAALGYGCDVLATEAELAEAIAAKYAFIVTVNALGFIEARTMGAWLAAAPQAVRALTADALRVAAARLGIPALADLRLDFVVAQVERGMTVLGDTPAAGRTAQARLEGALATAARVGVAVPALASAAARRLP